VGVLILAGTRKGLFLLKDDESRRRWEVEGPLLSGWEVYHAVLDSRSGALYTAANNFVYGGTVQRSDDLGQTWGARRRARASRGQRADARRGGHGSRHRRHRRRLTPAAYLTVVGIPEI
jgi:hypothetical protein